MPPAVDVDMDASEESPLLDAGDRADEPISSKPRFRPSRWQAKSPGTIVMLVAFMKFCVTGSGMMILIPIYRLIEDALCHVYYENDSPELIDEMECKVDEVQTELAIMIGWFNLVAAIMTLLVAFPYGMLADKIGRKPTALLSYVGLAVSFAFTPLMLSQEKGYVRNNPYVLLVGCLFQLFGGGVPVMFAALYAIAADVSSEKDKAASFLYLTFGATAGGLTGPLITGLLMEKYGPWVPIYVAMAVTPPMICILLFIPETLSVDVKAQHSDDQLSFKTHMSNGLRDLFHSFEMLRNINVPLVLVTFLFQSARLAAYTSILAQYISKHFGWKLAETSLLLSPLGVVNLVLLAVLPKISQVLISARFGLTSFQKDLFLTRVSTLILILGSLIEGFSHNIVLFIIGLFISTLGAADSPLARATVSHYVAPEFNSRLYALVGMTEVLGSFIGGPVLARLFGLGIKWKGIWQGLPWFYIGFLCAVALVALVFVRPPHKKGADEGIQCDGQQTNGHQPGEHLRTD